MKETDDFRDHLSELLEDEDFKREWDADEPEFRLRKALIEARIEAGLTQEQLSQRTGIDQRVISRLETGRGNPTFKTLLRLAEGFGKTLRLEFV